jgi:hypothetical protein
MEHCFFFFFIGHFLKKHAAALHFALILMCIMMYGIEGQRMMTLFTFFLHKKTDCINGKRNRGGGGDIHIRYSRKKSKCQISKGGGGEFADGFSFFFLV